jgi:hypothetical protein
VVWKRASFARRAVHVTQCEFCPPFFRSRFSRRICCCFSDHLLNSATLPRQRRLALARRTTRSADVRRPVARLARVDRRRLALRRRQRRRALAQLWRRPLPQPGGLPGHAVEPMTLLMRPRNLFASNPVMNVPPAFSSTPSLLAAGKAGWDGTDRGSRLAFRNGHGEPHGNGDGTGAVCCEGGPANGAGNGGN